MSGHNDEKRHENDATHKGKTYFFFVGSTKYETEHASLTGAQIKALVVTFDPTHVLMLEGNGDEPDITVEDNTTISLENKHGGPCHFYSVPPATFG
jgi:hypothetical protein